MVCPYIKNGKIDLAFAKTDELGNMSMATDGNAFSTYTKELFECIDVAIPDVCNAYTEKLAFLSRTKFSQFNSHKIDIYNKLKNNPPTHPKNGVCPVLEVVPTTGFLQM